MTSLRAKFASLSMTVGTVAILSAVQPAAAQTRNTISVPAMPLAQALQEIAAQSGRPIHFDPDAVRGRISRPVAAANAEAAVQQAVAGQELAVDVRDASIEVFNDIIVVARRDEAETGYGARTTTTSTRSGLSLREQPRNAQVVTSKLMQEQQAQSVTDALRNAGGVMVNNATIQGGITYSVRGFDTVGITNGLPSTAALGLAASGTQSLVNVERLEVLKGPDALLAGANNLGGTVNIVTKKPAADPYVYAVLEGGSFGQYRGTIDATGGLNPAHTVSARVIASVNEADRNWGGYAGTRDNLIATSLRFKNANTDAIFSVSMSDQFTGASPYTLLNPATKQPFAIALDKPLFGRKQQGVRTQTTQVFGEVTQKVADWLTVVARGQHQDLDLDIASYAPFGVMDSDGTVFASNGVSRQKAASDAVDGYARLTVSTGPLKHQLIGGVTYVANQTLSLSASNADFFPYNVLTATAPAPAYPALDQRDFQITSSQTGYYGQYLLSAWKLRFMAGIRRNEYESRIDNYTWRTKSYESNGATTPNFGLIFDLNDHISLYGSQAYGYSPTTILDWRGNKLPDLKTRNSEAGVKVDLFGNRVLLNASWFRLYQSVSLIPDPQHPGRQLATPGLQGEGIDLHVSGEITPSWMISASYTRTDYKMLTYSQYGNTPQGKPKDQYSFYTSYRHALGGDMTGGLGAGVFGRSSAAVTRTGSYWVPAALQVDVNAFLKWRAFDLNVGVRNVFHRLNYGISYQTAYLPIQEPRTVRVTLGYRFR